MLRTAVILGWIPVEVGRPFTAEVDESLAIEVEGPFAVEIEGPGDTSLAWGTGTSSCVAGVQSTKTRPDDRRKEGGRDVGDGASLERGGSADGFVGTPKGREGT